jgi:anaerobic ribonucleoside-triphosphate reductase activating protein
MILETQNKLEGITISGGEPFQQSKALKHFLEIIKSKSKLSVLVFTGYTIPEVTRMKYGVQILSLIDVLIAGRYNRKLHNAKDLLGSKNQIIHLLSKRYSMEQVSATPENEILINPEGNIVVTGIGGIVL